MKDSTDLGDVSFFLDSDGRVNDNEPRAVSSFQSVVDGKWHMITITSRPDLQRGCVSLLCLAELSAARRGLSSPQNRHSWTRRSLLVWPQRH